MDAPSPDSSQDQPAQGTSRPRLSGQGLLGPVREDSGVDALPQTAWLVALVSLPHVGPAALRAMMAKRTPRQAWERIVAGSVPETVPLSRRDAIIEAARRADVVAQWQRYERSAIDVLTDDDPRWPSRLLEDPEPPAVLFARGQVLDPPVGVAIVGTRACTTYGREIATELGRAAASAGVCVVSGLAMGIDAAAHRGALSAGGAAPVAVLGAGFDRPVPDANRGLFDQVIHRGVVFTETPLGAPSGRWRFPARNRIIAALVDAVVVVESDEKGGSLYTVDAALQRDRAVLAVPGSIRSRTSRGTNALLVDGAAPCRGIHDVFDALGYSPGQVRHQRIDALSEQARTVLDWGPADRVAFDDLVRDCGVAPGRLFRLIDELQSAGLVLRDGAYVYRAGPIVDQDAESTWQ